MVSAGGTRESLDPVRYIGNRSSGLMGHALAAAEASLVWSPFSNMWLYGGTVDIVAAKAAGVRVCLGSDWAPSGTKHVLGELKVAELCNRAPGAWRQPTVHAGSGGTCTPCSDKV